MSFGKGILSLRQQAMKEMIAKRKAEEKTKKFKIDPEKFFGEDLLKGLRKSIQKKRNL